MIGPLSTAPEIPTSVLTAVAADDPALRLSAAGVDVVDGMALKDGRLDLDAVLALLAKRGLHG